MTSSVSLQLKRQDLLPESTALQNHPLGMGGEDLISAIHIVQQANYSLNHPLVESGLLF